MTSYLQADNISRRIGDRILFHDISFNIDKDDRVALIAMNGAGKSSLLDILAGVEASDSGSLSFRRGLKTAYLRQYPALNELNTIIDELFSGDSPLFATVREYERATLSGGNSNIEGLIQKMDDLKAWDCEVAVRQILDRLKLHEPLATVGRLSGGERKRVALAKTLVEDSDLLILDEPTNHLDIDMIEWLEEYLGRSNRTVLMVTHDRYFLDRVCNVIMELTPSRIFSYPGNYRSYLERKEERERIEKAGTDRANNLLRTELEWMRRMPRARSHKSKSRIDAFYSLRERATQGAGEKAIAINVNTARLGGKILDLKNISKSYGGRPLFSGFSYSFNRYEKTGLTGRNGAGKSSLLNIITGAMPPDSGTVEKGETVVFGYYRQEGIEFDSEMTVAEAVRNIAETVTLGNGSTVSASQFMNYFLFPPDRQYTLIRKLSGGERRRLYLLTVLIRSPNFLILDEPTNDLDIITLNVLEEYLATFAGCVLVVSHDRYFMDKVVDHIFEFRDSGVIRNFPGNYTQLRESNGVENAGNRQSASSIIKAPASKPAKNRMTFAEKREFEQLAAVIEKLEAEKHQIEAALNSTALLHEELQQKSEQYGAIISELDSKEMRWLELSEKDT
ncbi:MAG: ABC-F family ATP-binding cassette domain-containing protein [Bacteroidales bacterium]|jgi:ATP-binding cassette subfamily F protein uup|nr:ABC-F family ATP-binding cassette domain-containing protein [Bacteroidales bacterium]